MGALRLRSGPSYLATLGADGSPCLHPVNPEVHADGLSLCMFPTSPNAADLRRDPRFALHAGVDDVRGGGESAVRGAARFVDPRPGTSPDAAGEAHAPCP